MLRIKNDKWNEFVSNSSIFGFELNDLENYYCRYYFVEDKYPKDTFCVMLDVDNHNIVIETENDRYAGFSTDGSEYDVIFDLIQSGYIEKI